MWSLPAFLCHVAFYLWPYFPLCLLHSQPSHSNFLPLLMIPPQLRWKRKIKGGWNHTLVMHFPCEIGFFYGGGSVHISQWLFLRSACRGVRGLSWILTVRTCWSFWRPRPWTCEGPSRPWSQESLPLTPAHTASSSSSESPPESPFHLSPEASAPGKHIVTVTLQILAVCPTFSVLLMGPRKVIDFQCIWLFLMVITGMMTLKLFTRGAPGIWLLKLLFSLKPTL